MACGSGGGSCGGLAVTLEAQVHVAHGSWPVAASPWPLPHGPCPMAHGSWTMGATLVVILPRFLMLVGVGVFE